MNKRIAFLTMVLAGTCISQSRQGYERPVRQAVRGVHGAVAAGSEYATEAGMRMYYRGGNAVDVGVATMFAASVTELSHFGLGGEAPILIRTKDGKVHAIAGVGTMPKLATADMFRKRPLQAGEVEVRGKNGETGLKGMIPVAGLMPALVPSMMDAGLLALREYGTKSFQEAIASAIEDADGYAIDEMRAQSIAASVEFFELWPTSKAHFLPNGRRSAGGRNFPPARYGPHPARHGGGGKEGSGAWRFAGSGHRRGARLFLSRRNRPQDRRLQQGQRRAAALRRHGRVQAAGGGTGFHHLPRLHGVQARLLEPGSGHAGDC